MTLVEFLKARLDEDEEAARAALAQLQAIKEAAYAQGYAEGLAIRQSENVAPIRPDLVSDVRRKVEQEEPPPPEGLPRHYSRHEPDRVLREVEAKRRIVTMIVDVAGGADGPDNIELSGIVAEDLLKLLALPYADHCDYRDEWRPA